MAKKELKSMLKRSLHYSHELLKEVINPGDTVVDSTMGNGNDTLFLAKLVGEDGYVHAFDVQGQALENTSQKIKEHHCEKQTKLHLTGHENLGAVIDITEQISAAVFNLGYLPKSDKSIVTHEATTIKALEELLLRLKELGRIVLVIYDGHDAGKIEKQKVLNFVESLPQDVYSVLSYQFINQRNNPPSLICIEKKPQKHL